MCGIVGVISYAKGGLTHNELNLVKEMLYVGAVRGKDSTGLMCLDNNGVTNWVKDVGLPEDLVSCKDGKDFFSSALFNSRAVFGHNRSATKGKIITDNAHPFEEEHIVLIHNGTLTNSYEFTEMRTVEVDSHLITKLIATRGVEETLQKIRGAFTLVWLDDKEKKIKIIRNEERPLVMAYNIKDEKFYFASENSMLHWMLTRNRISFDGMVSIQSGDLYEFSLDTCEYTQTKMELVKPPVYHVQTYHTRSYSPPVKPQTKVLLSPVQMAKNTKVITQVKDYSFLDDGKVLFKGDLMYPKNSEINFIGTEKDIDLLDDTEKFLVTIVQAREVIRNGEKFWVYTGKDFKPMYNNVALNGKGEPRRCPICDFLIKTGKVVHRMSKGESEYVCEDCSMESQTVFM